MIRARASAPPLALGLAVLTLSACGQTGQAPVDVALVARALPPGTLTPAGLVVELDRAEVAFGPLFLCATAAASSELCPSAQAEYLDAGTIDLLTADEQPLGRLVGVTGAVRSATWDYGLTWFATQASVTPMPAAPDGHAAVFEGTVARGGRVVRFAIHVDARPQLRGTRTVEGAPTSADLTERAATLALAFDAAAWLDGVDFAAIADAGTDPTVVGPDDRRSNAIVLSMTQNALPTFTWEPTPTQDSP